MHFVILVATLLADFPIVPDPSYQEQIRHTFIGDEDSMTREESEARIARLKEMHDKDPRKMVAQLFYAEFHSDTPPLIASYCMALLRTGPDDLVYGVMPFLHVEHEDLRAKAQEILSGLQCRCMDGGVDFMSYYDLIADEPPPVPLIRYMFERSPSDALFIMQRRLLKDIAQARSVVWAEHVISDALWKRKWKFTQAAEEAEPEALRQLNSLSQSEHWWIRLYVAEVLRNNRQFRTGELVDRLGRDSDPTVRAAVARPSTKEQAEIRTRRRQAEDAARRPPAEPPNPPKEQPPQPTIAP